MTFYQNKHESKDEIQNKQNIDIDKKIENIEDQN